MKDYSEIFVESYIPTDRSKGLHGEVHIRPCKGQDPFLTSMHVECSKKLSEEYPVGTKFKIKARLISRLGSDLFPYSYHGWSYTIVSEV